MVLGFEASPSDSGTGLVVELSPHDALPIDDSAFGRVPPGRKLTTIASPPHHSPWFERALLADPDLELLGVPLGELGTSAIGDDALVVVSGACPAELPGSDFVILNPPAGACHGAVVGEPVEAPVVTSWERTDPRLRFITLDGVSIARARAIDPPSTQSLLVKSREGALISDVSEAGRTGTLIGFDVGESNWPLRASFVLFVRNIAELARCTTTRLGPAARITCGFGPTCLRKSADDPSGKRVSRSQGRLAIIPDRATGYYLVIRGSRPSGAVGST